MKNWQILLVDDEPDVHSITTLVLRQKRCLERGFEITSATSRTEATGLLDRQSNYHVAIIDMAMEEETSGLDLCEHIRRVCPASMRLILRTGQPGHAPRDPVLNALDIDHYVTKSGATPAKLYSLIRACLRGYQTISTQLAYDRQLRDAVDTFQSLSSRRQERLAHQQLPRDHMYSQRMESLATIATGLAQELNTRLGIARTANTRLTDRAELLPQESSEELKEVCQLLMRNLDRAQKLIQGLLTSPDLTSQLQPPSSSQPASQG